MTGYLWQGKPDLEEQNEAIMRARPEVHARGGRRTGQPGRKVRGPRNCPRTGGLHQWEGQVGGDGEPVVVCGRCGARG